MSQNDFNLANQGFPAMRADMNSAFQALASNSAGTTEPSTTYAYQWWYDETTDILKIRNADDDAWINIASFDQANDTWSPYIGSAQLTATADEINILDGVTASTAELNLLDGVTADTAELNILDGVTATTAELNQLDGNTFTADLTIPDKIIHSGDTNTSIRFPAADTVTVETAGSERARIDASGNLLLGTTSSAPASAPEDSRIVSLGSSNQAAAHFFTDLASKTLVYFSRSAAGTVGSISVSGSATAYNTSSDYRLKEDVKPMVGASDRLMALRPVNFAWKLDGSRVDGFLAHEAQDVVPEAVTGEKDGEEMQAIDQSKLVPLMTAAMQEALGRIETLEAEVAALKGA